MSASESNVYHPPTITITKTYHFYNFLFYRCRKPRINTRHPDKTHYGSSAASSHYGSSSRSLNRATTSYLGHTMQATSCHCCNVYLHYDMQQETVHRIHAALLHLTFHDIGTVPLHQGLQLASIYLGHQSLHAAPIHVGFVHSCGNSTDTSCKCNTGRSPDHRDQPGTRGSLCHVCSRCPTYRS